MKRKAVGYIVVNADGRPQELGRHGKDEPLILLWGNGATVFPERRDARNAIRRTERYARRHDLQFRVWFNHSIIPLLIEEEV